MSTLPVTHVLVFLAISAGILAWAIHIFSRVNRHAAHLLTTPHMSWDVWRGSILLDGIWNGVRVRIRSAYVQPGGLFVTIRVVTSPPDLDAFVNRSGKIEFRAIRKAGRERILARVVEGEPVRPASQGSVSIHAYFTNTRLECLRALLCDLGWERFQLNEEGIGVSWSGDAHVRWKPHQARQHVLRTLVELQKMGI